MSILGILSNILADTKTAAEKSELHTAYREYLEARAPSEEYLSAQREVKFANTPMVDVIIMCDASNEHDAKATLSSVMSQTYSAVSAYICCESSAAFSDVNASVVECVGTDEERFLAVMSTVSGNCLMFLFAGDVLDETCIFELVCELNSKNADFVYCDSDRYSCGKRLDPNCKPDYSPDTLQAVCYIENAFLLTKQLFDKCGGMRSLSNRSIYNLTLDATHAARRVVHVKKLLFSVCKRTPLSTQEHRTCVNSFFQRAHETGYAVHGLYDGSVQIRYPIQRKTNVCIVVINEGSLDELMDTLTSIEETTIFPRYKVIVANTVVCDERLSKYIDILRDNKAATILSFSQADSFAAICNSCAEQSDAKHIIFLRSGIEIITADWIEKLVQFVEQHSIGIVAPKVIKRNNAILHAGIVIGINGWWDSPYLLRDDLTKNDATMDYFVNTQRNVSAIAPYCFMVSADSLESVGGFDTTFQTDACVVELCLRMQSARQKCIYTPFAKVCYSKEAISLAPKHEDYVRSYDVCRSILKNGDPNYSIHFSYSGTLPVVSPNNVPAIELNPLYKG